jgi:hypothetical protein
VITTHESRGYTADGLTCGDGIYFAVDGGLSTSDPWLACAKF